MRKYLPLLLLWPFTLLAQPPASSLKETAPAVRNMLEAGRAYEPEGNYLEAEMKYLQALGSGKSTAVVYQHLAYLYLRTQQWDKAEAALNKMEGKFPEEEAIAHWVKLPAFKFEIPTFRKPVKEEWEHVGPEDKENLALVAGNPRNAPAHLALGRGYWSMEGKDSLAEYHFHQAIAAQSNFPEARRGLGQLLQSQGRFGEAEIHFKYNLKNAPDTLAYWDDLALLYFQWNRPGKLEQTWRDQLKVFPSDQRALRNLGLLLETQGRYVEVERLYLEYQYAQKDRVNGFILLEDHYLRSMQTYPDSIRFQQALAELYYQQLFIQPLDWTTLSVEDSIGYPKYLARESLRHYQFVLEKRPDHPTRGQVSYQMGHLECFLKNYREAIPFLEQAIPLLKEKTDPQFLLVDAYLGADRPLDALQLLDSLANQPGLDYEHDVKYARLLALSGRHDEALLLADSIIAYYPNSKTPDAYRIKAFVSEHKGDPTGAFEALQEVVTQDYASAVDYYQIARLYFAKEPRENGLIWLDGALVKGLPKIIVQKDPALDGLRTWDGFLKIMAGG